MGQGMKNRIAAIKAMLEDTIREFPLTCEARAHLDEARAHVEEAWLLENGHRERAVEDKREELRVRRAIERSAMR